jgi:hypothetical protein
MEKTHWQSPNTGATNETGFTVLPGGTRATNVKDGGVGTIGLWQSSTNCGVNSSYYRYLASWKSELGQVEFAGGIFRLPAGMVEGLSVRCLRD